MPKILYLVNEDWAFRQHFLPIARMARAIGLDVVVATRVRQSADLITAEGFRIVPLESERRSLDPLEILRSIARIGAIVQAEQADIVHCLALRMVVLGGIAARLRGARCLVLAPTGLGHLWIANGPIERLGRPLVRFIVGRWLRRSGTHYVFENADDPRELALDPHGSDVTLVGGAGVDPKEFTVEQEPVFPPVRVAVVARMLKPKGIAESVAAVGRARMLGANAELHLFGDPDPSNRTSLSEAELRAFAAEPGIYWHGRDPDIRRIWRDHHVAMLLSYREGLPKSLVEAAASGRPIIATDVTGCREVVRHGVNGVLVPLGDAEAAAQAVLRLSEDWALRYRMGAAGSARFHVQFTEEAVTTRMEQLYRRLLAS